MFGWIDEAIQSFALSTVESPWVLLVVFALCIGDAALPPLPSETVVIAVATVLATEHPAGLWLLGGVAAVGAFCGDQVVFRIGRRLGAHHPRWLRGRRVTQSVASASRAIHRSGPVLIMVGRFIPVGRTAMNLAAGASGLPLRKFSLFSACAGLLWAAYFIAIGTVFGRIFAGEPLLALVFGVASAFVIGIGVERVSTGVGRRRRAKRGEDAGTAWPVDGEESGETSTLALPVAAEL